MHKNMSGNQTGATGTDYRRPGWLVWSFVFISLLTFAHWAIYNTGRLERGDSLLVADGVKYFVFLPSVLMHGDLDFADEIEEVSTKAARREERGKGPLTKTAVTGLVSNAFPIGAPVLWSPFYVVAHILIRGEGVEPGYQLAVLFSSLCYGLAALWLMIRILRSFFSPALSLFSALLVWAGSFGYFYAVYRGDMSHAPSVFLVALVLWLWLRFYERFTWGRAVVFGVAAGLMILTRPQNALMLLVPAAHSAWNLVADRGWRDYQEWLRLAGRWGLAALFVFIIFLPQLLVWNAIFGAPQPPMASNFYHFDYPYMVELLFSRNGIISFTPLLGLALIGMFLAVTTEKRFLAPCLGVLLLYIVLYSVSGDWWCGDTTFGIRRFANVMPLLAVGMAAFLQRITELFRSRPAVATGIITAPLLLWNFLSMQTVSEHKGTRDYLSLIGVAETNYRKVWDLAGWPPSMPGSIPYALANSVPPSSYDAVTGKPIDSNVGNLLLIPELLVEGWELFEATENQWIISDSRARILFSINRPHRLEGEIVCILRLTPPKDKYVLTADLNARNCGSVALSAGRSTCVFRYSADVLRVGINELSFRIFREEAEGKRVPAGRVENVRFRHVIFPQVQNRE